MSTPTRTRNPASARTRGFGAAVAVSAAAKALFGALLAVLLVVAWQQFDNLREQQSLNAGWKDLSDYAVFYPLAVGNDRDNLASGSDELSIAIARDLYPALDKAGALYVDAINYVPDAPKQPVPPWPTRPIRVNTNYLKKYPILDESGKPISIDDSEQSWVVAVPIQFKSREAEFKAYLQEQRTGGERVQGAVQAYGKMLGEPAPAQFAHQSVRIVWMAPGQEVFSFNSLVNPDGGNMIEDPVIEIMTPANSLFVDRLNAIPGALNPPLKVLVNGDPQAVFRDVTPQLKELKLDDNLQHLVSGYEAVNTENAKVRSAINWLAVFAGAALVVMLLLNATMVLIASDRQRKRITVRRLHGMGVVRSYRELFTFLGVAALWQAILAGALLGILMALGVTAGAALNPMLMLVVVIVASLLLESPFLLVLVNVTERRNAVRRLKEL
ncbi:hypothetical protein [Actinoplanes sp. L3-i22]|uniref:hypothetical protein n=1 Tax=Actinoplanes sp. L3-i22 TaxID=2836373 RepID=UPI001C799746|nr:hypothetical protein [Actinoplanes sp. L3-i22]BCY09099.1 hypothetical protein L3i22_041870 [Actinoplanes sp. L3-i22]